MDYIVFLLTIQTPFLYLVWKIFQTRAKETRKDFHLLKRRTENIANFMDTLRLSVEKISEDIYREGQVNAKMRKMDGAIKDLKKSLAELELYTGMSDSALTEDMPSAGKPRDFNYADRV